MDPYKDLNKSGRRRSGSRNRKSQHNASNVLVVVLAVLLLLAVGALLYVTVIRPNQNRPSIPVVVTTDEAPETESIPASSSAPSGAFASVLEIAGRRAVQYDFDGAVQYVKDMVPDYEKHAELTNFISECMAQKMSLVKIDNKTITHIFFHILVWDEQTAFSVHNQSRMNYNTVMTTAQEFKDIIQEMYDRDYVLVSLHDIAKVEKMADGTEKMVDLPIYLPEGKKAFVMSQDDVCYYEYMLKDAANIPASERGETYTGCATKLVINEAGKIVNEMQMADGSFTYGAFDLVPILDEFIEAHPDFSYKGHKATLALTGYNGILGYRTSYIGYGSDEILNRHYDELFRSPYFDEAYAYSLARDNGVHEYDVPDIEEQRAAAARVAQALLDDGYTFASHTWGHMNMSTEAANPQNPSARLYRDTQWWDVEVAPLIGGTDIIIFAFGGDMGWRPYSAENMAYRFLKSMGFSYFCNVDASQHTWMQLVGSVSAADGSYTDSGYYRMARRNLDGQRMLEDILYPEKERLSDLFDSKKILSRNRPLPTAADIGTRFIGVLIPEGFDPAHMFD
ncbi:MAG: polysaccharide deacetylase [Lachnospiraceae bacterium]|nr:polysaccharide deacetylase [Lachnospiraceae bacterium]